MRSFAGQVGKY